SYVVKAGHRIRLAIVNAYPRFGFLDPADAKVSIYRDADHASSISLPITSDPITVKVEVQPETLDPEGKEEFSVILTPPFDLGKGYRAEDIDVGALMCNGFRALSTRLSHNALVADFQRQALGNTSATGSVKLDVTGNFHYDIPFIGSKTVRGNSKGEIRRCPNSLQQTHRPFATPLIPICAL
ncbi:MAG: hypothetical protein H6Q04_3314, partial [Acidobacteria bacterium]|nr:hypothetical protein [Acidobacteriota bacterium]